MGLESSGKFIIHYDYTDWFQTNYNFNNEMVIWEYKYLGNKPGNPETQRLIKKYLKEYPDNPI